MYVVRYVCQQKIIWAKIENCVSDKLNSRNSKK